MHYTHLAKEERYYVFNALKSGKLTKQVAREINRYVSTVSRELSRNKGLRGYRYRQAEKKSPGRQFRKGKTRIVPQTWIAVTRMIHLDLCPEQISGSLAAL